MIAKVLKRDEDAPAALPILSHNVAPDAQRQFTCSYWAEMVDRLPKREVLIAMVGELRIPDRYAG